MKMLQEVFQEAHQEAFRKLSRKLFKKLFGKPKSSATDIKPHGKTDAMTTIERLNEVSLSERD